MNLDLRGIENIGDLERERVVVRATQDVDIGDFAIFKCRKSADGGVASGHVPDAYWFPDRTIKSGDFVVLYTKKGTASEKKGETGSTTYFYYWGWARSQWSDHIAALVHTAAWDFWPEPK